MQKRKKERNKERQTDMQKRKKERQTDMQKRNKERKKERKTHIYKLTDTKATKNQKSGSVGYSSLLSW